MLTAKAIENPNTDLTLWESGAIITYLIEQYDKENVLTYSKLKEKHLLNQWLHFQMSGQGPYFGQAGWFTTLHPEKLPSAIARYTGEVKRVLSVLDGWLKGKQWLVGDKITYADLAFSTWNSRLDNVLNWPEEEKFCGFENVNAWHERMVSRPSWKRATEIRAKLMDEQGLNVYGAPKDNDPSQYVQSVQGSLSSK